MDFFYNLYILDFKQSIFKNYRLLIIGFGEKLKRKILGPTNKKNNQLYFDRYSAFMIKGSKNKNSLIFLLYRSSSIEYL